jgi:transmembrane sensor
MIREVLTLSELRAMPADEAAALWTVRLAEGDYPHERELFDEWLELAPGNREAWALAQRAWSVFDASDDDELLGAMRLHARAARPQQERDWRRYAAAAALFLVVASGSILAERSLFREGHPGTGSPAAHAPVIEASYTYSSGRELPKRIALPDGSELTLDAQSQVSATFTPTRRSLEVISGRASFNVRHNPARPFLVRAMGIQVTDIGTRFDVQVTPTEVRVLLVEGRVSVAARHAAAPVLLSPGQQLVARGDAPPVVSAGGSGDQPGWQQGFATFDNDTLTEAAELLNRYPGDRLVVRDPRVASLRVSGMFRIGDPQRFGRTLEQVYPVRIVRRGRDELEIVPAG